MLTLWLAQQPMQATSAAICHICYDHKKNRREIENKYLSWLSKHINKKTENSIPMCSSETQPLPTNQPKKQQCAENDKNSSDLQGDQRAPAMRCSPPWVTTGESCRHLAFSPFSTLSLLGWEPRRVLVFIPLSLASYIAYVPQLWLLLRAYFYSTFSGSLSLSCYCVHLYYTCIQVSLKNYEMALVSVHYKGMQTKPASHSFASLF